MTLYIRVFILGMLTTSILVRLTGQVEGSVFFPWLIFGLAFLSIILEKTNVNNKRH
jgi:hypothetical protein